MSVSLADIQSFADFAKQNVHSPGTKSIEDLLRLWRESREMDEVCEAIREGEAEYEAGGGRSVDQVCDEVRARLEDMK